MPPSTSRRGSASRAIGPREDELEDWPKERLVEIRRIIHEAAPEVVEARKWRLPSRPRGLPVWSHGGIMCVGDSLKNRVRLTFPKGASLRDPKGLFNARLDSRTMRAIDIPDGEPIHEGALKELIRRAAAFNAAASRKR